MRIYLRPITISDTSHILLWRNSEKVIEHCLSKQKITEESHIHFFKEYVETGKYKQFIVERIDEDFSMATYPIATVYLKDFDEQNKRCELCVFTSNDQEWIAESQVIAIRMLIDKAFNEYGMHKLYSYVFSKFPDEVELLKSSGFEVESILKDEAVGLDGKYEDIVRLCCIKD